MKLLGLFGLRRWSVGTLWLRRWCRRSPLRGGCGRNRLAHSRRAHWARTAWHHRRLRVLRPCKVLVVESSLHRIHYRCLFSGFLLDEQLALDLLFYFFERHGSL